MNKQELQSHIRLIAASGEPKRASVRAAATVRFRLGALSPRYRPSEKVSFCCMGTKRPFERRSFLAILG